jgi:hypothetical protein
MKDLLEKLAGLADQLDQLEAPEIADEVDLLMKNIKDEVAQRVSQEEKLTGICSTCGGSGAGIDEPWCEDCNGTGSGDFIVESSLHKIALKPPYVRRRGNKFVVLDKHTGKVLSEHDTKEKANASLRAMHVRRG